LIVSATDQERFWAPCFRPSIAWQGSGDR
jgi:hypothetical protein